MQDRLINIKKVESKQQIIYGEVYVPDVIDTDGDFMTAFEIQKTAHNFMKTQGNGYINIEHSNLSADSAVVESFVARPEDGLFIPGSWVVGVHIPCEDTWALVEKGEINAFSMEATGLREPVVIDVELTEVVKGETVIVEGHSHCFEVLFDGVVFQGGHTGISEDGHCHNIIKGTATETVNDHSHAFRCIEVWANV